MLVYFTAHKKRQRQWKPIDGLAPLHQNDITAWMHTRTKKVLGSFVIGCHYLYRATKHPSTSLRCPKPWPFVICRLVSSGTTLVQNKQFYSVQRLQIISSFRLIWQTLLFILVKFVLTGLSAFQTGFELNINIGTAIVKPFCLFLFFVRMFVIFCRDKQCFQVNNINFVFFYFISFWSKKT